jgi:hypothetical protein
LESLKFYEEVFRATRTTGKRQIFQVTRSPKRGLITTWQPDQFNFELTFLLLSVGNFLGRWCLPGCRNHQHKHATTAAWVGVVEDFLQNTNAGLEMMALATDFVIIAAGYIGTAVQ